MEPGQQQSAGQAGPGQAQSQGPPPGPKRGRASFLASGLGGFVLRHINSIVLALVAPPLLGAVLAVVAGAGGRGDFPTIKAALLSYSLLSIFALLLGAANCLPVARREWGGGRTAVWRAAAALAAAALASAVQSALMVFVFSLAAKLPGKGVFLAPLAEVWLPTFAAAYAASALAILIASVASSVRKALIAGLAALLAQASVFVALAGAVSPAKRPLLSALSTISICRWSLESYGATADFPRLAANDALKKAKGAVEKGYEAIRPLDQIIGGKIEGLKDSILNNEQIQSFAGGAMEDKAKKMLESRGLSPDPPKQRITRAWAMLAVFALCFSVSAFGALVAKHGEAI